MTKPTHGADFISSQYAKIHDRIVVIDFGAQYGQLISRRIRDLGVYCELVPATITATELAAQGSRLRGIILSGGPQSVNVEGAPLVDPAIFELDVPILGICYGQQLMAKLLGGEVASAGTPEYGSAIFTKLQVNDGYESAIIGNLPASSNVWMSHFDSVTTVPKGFVVTGTTQDCPVAAMEHTTKPWFAVQFHPEVTHTEFGNDVLDRFIAVTGVARVWNNDTVIDQAVEAIRSQVGDAKVVCGLSGGVDSSVAATLVHRAIGANLVCVFVDHGLMRKNERAEVEAAFAQFPDLNLVVIDAQNQFLSALKGVTEPEQKRKIIGREFITTFEEARKTYAPDATFLVQGTLYSDVVESGHGDSATIKSHHNVGGLPDDLSFELVEPLRMLFKDEVRSIGETLGLPHALVWRQPFPGPGLGVRIIGEVTKERLEILREADAIVREQLQRCEAGKAAWQTFAVLPAVKAVGVQGDERTYGYPIIVRSVNSDDAMTATVTDVPMSVLKDLAQAVIAGVPQVNRVAYDITSKPPGTIEWE